MNEYEANPTLPHFGFDIFTMIASLPNSFSQTKTYFKEGLNCWKKFEFEF